MKKPGGRINGPNKLNRRKFIEFSLAATAGLYGLSSASPSEATGEEGEKLLTMLSWNHFVPASDNELKKQLGQDFARGKKIKGRFDTVTLSQMPVKKAAEAMARVGHDLIFLAAGDPYLYSNLLEDVSYLYEELGREHGGWFGLGKKLGMKEGGWKAIPWYFVSFPLVLRMDLWREVGESLPPETWEDLLRVGEKLKKKGYSGGIPISHCADSNAILRGILWSYGASVTAEDGKTITINSPQTAEALEFVNELYHRALNPRVLSWDNASNNRFLISGKGSFTFNPISAYKSAIKYGTKIPGTDKPIYEELNHYLPPKGPAGRHMYAFTALLGIWSFAKNKELAKEFIKYHYSKERFNAYIAASDGYNQPMLRDFSNHPVWSKDPKFSFAPLIGQYSHAQGYPGPPTRGSQQVMDLYLIPDMFANVVTRRLKVKAAIEWAEKNIREIFKET